VVFDERRSERRCVRDGEGWRIFVKGRASSTREL